jgi:hypothetical protein
MFWNDLWTIGLKKKERLNVKFWPGFPAQRFIAVLINNNISHRFSDFYVEKKSVGLMTNEEIISNCLYCFYLLTK